MPVLRPPTINVFAMLLPSPMKASFRPLSLPKYSRMVIRSASTWQGVGKVGQPVDDRDGTVLGQILDLFLGVGCGS